VLVGSLGEEFTKCSLYKSWNDIIAEPLKNVVLNTKSVTY
jgi:hypothetical protein